MKDTDQFIRAYNEFKESIDLSQSGHLPDLDNLTLYLLMGIPRVPADDDPDEKAQFEAIDQRVAILKAVFVEVNRDQTESFLEQGLSNYDRAGKMAKRLLKEGESVPHVNEREKT